MLRHLLWSSPGHSRREQNHSSRQCDDRFIRQSLSKAWAGCRSRQEPINALAGPVTGLAQALFRPLECSQRGRGSGRCLIISRKLYGECCTEDLWRRLRLLCGCGGDGRREPPLRIGSLSPRSKICLLIDTQDQRVSRAAGQPKSRASEKRAHRTDCLRELSGAVFKIRNPPADRLHSVLHSLPSVERSLNLPSPPITD